MIPPPRLSMGTGISSALGQINLTTLLHRRFASFGRAALHATVTRRATSCGFHPPRPKAHCGLQGNDRRCPLKSERVVRPRHGPGQASMCNTEGHRCERNSDHKGDCSYAYTGIRLL